VPAARLVQLTWIGYTTSIAQRVNPHGIGRRSSVADCLGLIGVSWSNQRLDLFSCSNGTTDRSHRCTKLRTGDFLRL
jgi:hypothetical protein